MGGGASTQRVARSQLLGRKIPWLLESVPATKKLREVLQDLFIHAHRIGESRRLFYDDWHEGEQREYVRRLDQVRGFLSCLLGSVGEHCCGT